MWYLWCSGFLFWQTLYKPISFLPSNSGPGEREGEGGAISQRKAERKGRGEDHKERRKGGKEEREKRR